MSSTQCHTYILTVFAIGLDGKRGRRSYISKNYLKLNYIYYIFLFFDIFLQLFWHFIWIFAAVWCFEIELQWSVD